VQRGSSLQAVTQSPAQGDVDLRREVREAKRILTEVEQLRANAKAKVKNYTATQCVFAIADCHEALQIGQYEYSHPYAQKLWAEIDALRHRASVLERPRYS
jgi:hypothetical protein